MFILVKTTDSLEELINLKYVTHICPLINDRSGTHGSEIYIVNSMQPLSVIDPSFNMLKNLLTSTTKTLLE